MALLMDLLDPGFVLLAKRGLFGLVTFSLLGESALGLAGLVFSLLIPIC